MLLDCCDTAYAAVVGERFIIGRDETDDLPVAPFLQDIEPEMAI